MVSTKLNVGFVTTLSGRWPRERPQALHADYSAWACRELTGAEVAVYPEIVTNTDEAAACAAWLRARQVDAVLQEEMGHSDDSSSASDAVKARLGEIYHQDEGMVVTDIPMERGQSLRIELTLVCGEGMRYQIHSWYVYDSGQYEIDNSMPVWDGSSGA